MKKSMFAILLMSLFFPHSVSADTKIHYNLGSLQLDLPFQTVNGIGLWDFVQKRGLAGVETPVAEWKHFMFKIGAVTSISGLGAPIVGADYGFTNPAENFIGLASFHPGVFGGYDFNAKEDPITGKKQTWILGLKASVEFFTIGN